MGLSDAKHVLIFFPIRNIRKRTGRWPWWAGRRENRTEEREVGREERGMETSRVEKKESERKEGRGMKDWEGETEGGSKE